jgi:hypothetical protein
MASLPPRIPDDVPTLDRLITLLGNRSRGPLTQKPKRELEALCGAYPDPPTAARWKTALKELRAELVAEDAPRAPSPPRDETSERLAVRIRSPRASALRYEGTKAKAPGSDPEASAGGGATAHAF